jgi:hypothetical protein
MPVSMVATESEFYSGKVSENVRGLSLGALAAIWVVADQNFGGLKGMLLGACFLVVLALALDFVQYMAGAWVYGHYTKKAEQEGLSKEAEMPFVLGHRTVIEAFFFAKCVALVVAYLIILGVVWSRFGEPPRTNPPPPSECCPATTVPLTTPAASVDAGATADAGQQPTADAGQAPQPDAGAVTPPDGGPADASGTPPLK